MTNAVFNTNYFNEMPDDVKRIIYKYTIPEPPPYPEKNDMYEIDAVNYRYMTKLVEYTPTSYVLYKRYIKIRNLLEYYTKNFIMQNKELPYSKKYQFNKLVNEFCQDHSTNHFKSTYKIDTRNGIPMRQKYIKRKV